MRLNDVTPAEWDEVGKMFTRDSKGNKIYKRESNSYTATAKESVDVVNKPPHYGKGSVECIDYIEQQLSPAEYEGYLAGNAMKYLHRFRYKNGVEDLEKHMWYVARLIDKMKEKN